MSRLRTASSADEALSAAAPAAREYRERLDNLDTDVRAHLDKAALTLAELSSARIGAGRSPTIATHRRSLA